MPVNIGPEIATRLPYFVARVGTGMGVCRIAQVPAFAGPSWGHRYVYAISVPSGAGARIPVLSPVLTLVFELTLAGG